MAERFNNYTEGSWTYELKRLLNNVNNILEGVSQVKVDEYQGDLTIRVTQDR